MYQEIADRIRLASHDKNKSSMFHFQVLMNAHELQGVDAHEFCREVGMPDSYATEFRKMLNLAKVMDEEGVVVTHR